MAVIGDIMRGSAAAALDAIDDALHALDQSAPAVRSNERITKAEGQLAAARMLVERALESLGERP